MTTRTPVKGSRFKLVAVIASPADLESALKMKPPPDLFELRLDCLWPITNPLEKKISRLRAPLIITARDPREGGMGSLSFDQRRDLLLRFLPRAKYVDVELRSARKLKPLLDRARKQNVRRIISFHDFKSTPSSRSLCAKARKAKAVGADVFKVATCTDKPSELARLVHLITSRQARHAVGRRDHRRPVKLPVSAMGIGKLGALSRLLLARCGSVLNYASLGRPTVEGQLPIEVLRSALSR